MSTTNSNSSRTRGSYWDKNYLSDDDYAEMSSLWDGIDNGTITASDANTRANQIRSKYGYNGGSDGSQYNTNTNTSTTTPTWLSNANTAMSNAMSNASAYSNATPFSYSRSTDYDTVLNSILNPKEFSYDYTTDPQYQAYKKQYTREGQRATADTLGQVAAMTGGQVSSNAVNAANQAGDYYSAQLSDKIPELYQAAYNMYQNDLQNQYNQLSALNTDRSYEYGVYGDNLSRLYNSANLNSGLASSNYDLYNNAQSAQDEKNLAAANLMADTGDYSRLAKYYGLSDDELSKIVAANTKTTSTGTPKKDEDSIDYDTALGEITSIYNSSGKIKALSYIDELYSGGYLNDSDYVKAKVALNKMSK